MSVTTLRSSLDEGKQLNIPRYQLRTRRTRQRGVLPSQEGLGQETARHRCRRRRDPGCAGEGQGQGGGCRRRRRRCSQRRGTARRGGRRRESGCRRRRRSPRGTGRARRAGRCRRDFLSLAQRCPLFVPVMYLVYFRACSCYCLHLRICVFFSHIPNRSKDEHWHKQMMMMMMQDKNP